MNEMKKNHLRSPKLQPALHPTQLGQVEPAPNIGKGKVLQTVGKFGSSPKTMRE